MRKLALALLLGIASFGCQPKVLIFNTVPAAVVNGPANVTIHWRISNGDGELSSDKPVTPSLVPPKPVDAEGSLVVSVCQTTTFKLEPHYGGEATTTVTVTHPCGSGPGGTGCAPQTLTFTGTCENNTEGPHYITLTVPAALATGNLAEISSDASLPVHVFHSGVEIPLGANGGPLSLPLPPVPAAGDYTIQIPGFVGQQLCKDAMSPVGGGTVEGPVIHLTIRGTCPMP